MKTIFILLFNLFILNFMSGTCYKMTHPPKMIRTLLIDNYDSYTYNLYHLLREVNGIEPIVVYNDAYNANWNELLRHVKFDNIVLSPGPGNPRNEADFGLCKDAIEKSTVPVLGVCLGHQGIGHLFGATVDKAPEPMHGRLSSIIHSGRGIFKGIPQNTRVVRYHSLAVKNMELTDSLEVTAWTTLNDNPDVIMGLQHKNKPIFGVQFHPESILTKCGRRLIKNFRDITINYRKNIPDTFQEKHISVLQIKIPYKKKIKDVAEIIFEKIYKNSSASFWLDSSKMYSSKKNSLSFMGSLDTPDSFSVEYYGNNTIAIRNDSNNHQIIHENIFHFLDQQNSQRKKHKMIFHHKESLNNSSMLPFDASEMFVGYFGYETRFDVSHILKHPLVNNKYDLNSTHFLTNTPSHAEQLRELKEPVSLHLFPTRYIVFDHKKRIIYAVSISKTKKSSHNLANNLIKIIKHELSLKQKISEKNPIFTENKLFIGKKWREKYKKSIDQSMKHIKSGESYEICLTKEFKGKISPNQDTFELYKMLRRNNPSPFSCYLRYDPVKHFNIKQSERDSVLHWYKKDGITICCSSPERFLKLSSNGILESKPIKGTAKRNLTDSTVDKNIAKLLLNDEKSRAENLMIVDLVRNDFGRVSEPGSVCVPKLIKIETYKTVHHLVSTIQGRLRKNMTVVDAIISSFPGGSMTGSPKIRTMDIIENLEQRPRGVYSGSIGYITTNNVADLNIVIRTIIISGNELTVSSGGAIVSLSDSKLETDEVFLKLQAVADAIGLSITRTNSS
jgi:para-aminobenzoate synthetase